MTTPLLSELTKVRELSEEVNKRKLTSLDGHVSRTAYILAMDNFITTHAAAIEGLAREKARLIRTEHYAGKYETLLCEALDLYDSNDLETHSASADQWVSNLREALDFTKPCSFDAALAPDTAIAARGE